MKHFLSIFLYIFLAQNSIAADRATVTGVITDIASFPLSYGSYDSSVKGLLGIWIEGMPKACGSGQRRVVIGEDHPLHGSVLSIALMAKATGKPVKVSYFEECTIREESWDFAYIWLGD